MAAQPSISIDEVLESILRGAAKTLGCNSATLIVFNEYREEVRIQVGLILERRQELAQVEEILRGAINDFVFDFEASRETEIHRAWRERAVFEVASLAELARGAFPAEWLDLADRSVGERRFLNVPVLGESRCYGVLVFEKIGTQPFSPQQREVLILYANRIGEIIEADSRSFPVDEQRRAARGQTACRLIIDAAGEIAGRSDGEPLPAALVDRLTTRARELLARGLDGEERSSLKWPENGPEPAEGQGAFEADLEPLLLGETPHVLCTVQRREPGPDRTIQDHLIQIALAHQAPALLLDPEFRITSCNTATCQFLGYATDELVGRLMASLFQDEQEIQNILNVQFLFVSRGHHQETAVVRKSNGDLVSAKVEALLLADEANRVIGYLVLLREEDTARDGAGERGVDRLMRRERLANMGQIAAQLAHEIRNPILAIGATLESLQPESGQPDRIMSSLSREINRLDMILRDYLSLAARQNATIRRVRLGEIIDQARDLLAGQQSASGKRIQTAIPGDLEIVADFDGLKQVFFNLFINALEASPSGETVSCGLEESESDIVINVDDAGPGLKSDPEQCFVPFFSTKSNGTGLGLTVCRNILTAHSGAITLANRAAGGCRVSVTLPRRGF